MGSWGEAGCAGAGDAPGECNDDGSNRYSQGLRLQKTNGKININATEAGVGTRLAECTSG
jgi:hypothetical protein